MIVYLCTVAFSPQPIVENGNIAIAPTVIVRKPRQLPKASSTQSSHEYHILNHSDGNENSRDLFASSSDSDSDLLSDDCDTESLCDVNSKSECHEAEFVPITLSANDVPGYDLPHPVIEKNKVEDLKRWLKLRKIQQDGLKFDLVDK